jgi:CheY-like chemotaxis protein
MHCFGTWFVQAQRAACVHRRETMMTATPSHLAGPARRVLVVDDLKTSRMVIRDMLELLGIEVLDAADGQIALDRLGTENVDMVLSDVHMPCMDGLTLTERLRHSPNLGRLPIVLMTGDASPATRTAAMTAGADALLIKDQHLLDHLLDIVQDTLWGVAKARVDA